MKKVNLLSRAEMRNVMGGYASPSTCTASCGTREDVTCTGSQCSKIDGVGCNAGDSDSKSCDDSPLKKPVE